MPPIDFAVSDKEMVASIEKTGSGQAIKNLLVSTEQPYIDHFTSIFDELWKGGIDAKDRIKTIEEGIDTEGIEIIQNPADIQKMIFDLLKSAREEILVIFSSVNAFHRQEYVGATQFLREAADERGVKARILTPKDDLIAQTAQRWMGQQKNQEQQSPKQQNISIRFIEPYLQTKVSLLIVDRKFSLAVELKDDAAAVQEKNGHNDVVIVSVRDTGQGIDNEILPRLFTKFATKAEAGGTGLGLFISKSIIEAHGGRIWAENNADGKGATFSFSLPIVNKQV